MDLTGWDLQRSDTVALDGEWEFYWMELLTPQDFVSDGPPLAGHLVHVPGIWNRYDLGGGEGPAGLPGDGYGTYRLVVRTGEYRGLLAIKILDFATSYRMWVNGEEVASNGRVGRTPEEAFPHAYPLVAGFAARGDEVEIVLQVSNFTHSKGGIWTEIMFGTLDAVQGLRDARVAQGFFLWGALTVLGLYHLGLYFQRRKERSYLLCALTCLLMAVRGSVVGETVILVLSPEVRWHTLYMLQYLTFYLAVPVFAQFIRYLYTDEVSSRAVRAGWVVGLAFSSSVVAAPPKVYSRLILYYEVWTLIMLIYLQVGIVRAALRKREGAIWFILGNLAIVLTAAHDVLRANELIYGPYLTDFGLFILMCFQAYVLSLRYSAAHEMSERLSVELAEHNRALEQRVKERTYDLERALKAADAANRAKSDFLAVMSHEIRTPMNSLVGMAELLADSGLDREQEEYAITIRDSAETLLTILNDILDFRKIEENKLTLERGEFSLAAVTGHAGALAEVQARRKGISFEMTVDAAVPQRLIGDQLRLRQVITNLLNNALKFTEQGKVRLSVMPVLVTEARATLRFKVSDTGPGIPEHVRSSVFDPFVQADESTTRRYGGTGLGLAICKRLVELMGGQIGFTTREGQGTEFWFTVDFDLPGPHGGLTGDLQDRARDESRPQVAAPPSCGGATVDIAGCSRGDVAGPGQNRDVSILVVEDTPLNRKVLLAQLRKLGYEAEAVRSGEEAVDAFSRKKYSMVLLDCHMPDMDGFETCRLMREIDRGRGTHTPVAAITASATSDDRAKCLAARMDDYLSKPVHLDDLEMLLGRHLRRAPARVSPAVPESLPELIFAAPEKRGDLARLVDGDPAFLASVLESFLTDMPSRLRAMEEALENGDRCQIELMSHAMKSSAALLGLTELSSTCAEMEAKAKAGGIGCLLEVHSRLQAQYSDVESKTLEVLRRCRTRS